LLYNLSNINCEYVCDRQEKGILHLNIVSDFQGEEKEKMQSKLRRVEEDQRRWLERQRQSKKGKEKGGKNEFKIYCYLMHPSLKSDEE
jgi:hypothetical protein